MWTIGLIAAVLCLQDLGPDSLAASRDEVAINGGRATEDGELEGVVGLIIANRALCTGVLVHPELVITAAHCLDDALEDEPIGIIFGGDLRAGPSRFARSWQLHPDWCPALGGCDRTYQDFAFIILDEPAPESVEPIEPLVFEHHWEAVTRDGARLELAGFGAQGTGRSAPLDGIKHVVTAPVRNVYKTEKIAVGEDGANASFGDSGGPALLRLPDGSHRVAGIASYIPVTAGNPKVVYMTLFPALCWVEEASALDLEAVPDGWDCKAPLPGPATGCTVTAVARPAWLPLILLAGVWRRRRSSQRA